MMDSPFNTTEAAIMAENAHSFFSTVLEKMEHFPIKISFIFGLSIILGSVVPYIPQYLTIQQSQNTEGFSLYVCLTLLVANILRIIFWFGNQYETPLLIQSIVMIAAMFALLELCVRVRNNNLILSRRKNYFTDFDWRYFWEWTDFISYFECMVAFTFIAGSIMFMFGHYKYVVESFGFAALVTESLLASPQFFRNFKSKSTEGMSRIMVVTWFIGDLYKTIYFIMRDTPVQFWLCGFIQITFDLLIFMQLFIYRKSNYKKLSKTAKSGATNQVQDRDQMLGTGTTVHQRQGINTGKADVILADNLTGPVNSGKEDSIKMHKIQ